MKAAKAFLSGKESDVQTQLSDSMQKASQQRDYERATLYRDQLQALAQIRSLQTINCADRLECDIIAVACLGGQIGIQVFFYRHGCNYGNQAYFPVHHKDQRLEEVISAFISQFYTRYPVPRHILVNKTFKEQTLLQNALHEHSRRKVSLLCPQRGPKKILVENAVQNVLDALERRLTHILSHKKHLEGVDKAFSLGTTPERIEVYDNSHTQGTNSLGAMVVAGPEGFHKKGYRLFKIRNRALKPRR